MDQGAFKAFQLGWDDLLPKTLGYAFPTCKHLLTSVKAPDIVLSWSKLLTTSLAPNLQLLRQSRRQRSPQHAPAQIGLVDVQDKRRTSQHVLGLYV